MARCERGYLCTVCGNEVEELIDSVLYLRYVLGEVEAETLHLLPEQHLRCVPALAQYVVDPSFAPVVCDGPFSKVHMDPAWTAAEEARVTRGRQRLIEVLALGLPLHEYPLDDVRGRDD